MGMLTASTISRALLTISREGEQPGIGEAESAMLAAAGDMHEGKAQPFDQTCLNAVVAARRNVTGRLGEHFLQGLTFFCCGGFHFFLPFGVLIVVILLCWATAGRPYIGVHRK